MVYCVVYNCTTRSTVKNVSFFGFPKDKARQKAWIHYCRRKDFVVTIHSRMCAKHFSPSQYLRYPSRLAELGYPNARAQLKDDAVPDIPWATNKESAASSNKTPRPYGAYRKRRRLEVLEELMKEEENIDAGNESNNSQNTSADNSKNTSADNSHELRDNTSHELRDDTSADNSTFESNTSTADKAVQVFIPDRSSKVTKRTRRIQTGKSYTNVKTTDSQVQCDEVRLCCNCLKSMESEGGKSEDRSAYMIF